MAWYRTGSITVTNGSVTVSGAGTAWISNAAIGEALYAPDGRLYEIVNIASDTTITLQSAYLGATASAQPYVIVPSQSYIRDLAAQAADLVNNYSTIYNTVGQGKFGDGTLAAPGIRFSDDLDTGFYRSASNEVTFVAGGTAIFKYNLTGGLSLTSGGDLVGTTATQTLTNKTLTAPVLGGTVTGTYTLGGTPTFPSSVVLTTGAQTLVSKTLTNPVINGFTSDTSIINIGSGQVYKDASGNVGIGTASPSVRLSFGTNSNQTFALFENPGGANLFGFKFTSGSGTDRISVISNASEAVSILNTGYVGVGTIAPGVKFDVANGDIRATGALLSYDGTTNSRLISFGGASFFGTTTNHPIIVQTNNTERMKIDTSGNVGIGTSSPQGKLQIVGSTFISSGALFVPNDSGIWMNGFASYGAGIVSDSAGSTLRFYSGSSLHATLDTSGNLGLGVTPSAWGSGFKAFDVGSGSSFANANSVAQTWLATNAYYNAGWKYKNTASASLYEFDSAHKWYTAPSGTAGNAISFTQAMTLDASGNLGIGVNSPSVRTEVSGSEAAVSLRVNTQNAGVSAGNYSQIQLADVGVVRTYWRNIRDGSGVTQFAYNSVLSFLSDAAGTPTERARMDSSGNLLVNGTSTQNIGGNGQKLLVYSPGTNGVGVYQTAAGGYCFATYGISNGGTYYHALFTASDTNVGSITSNATTTTYSTSSDYRLKNITGALTDSGSFIDALKPKVGTWIADGSPFVGFLAHEFAEVSPSSVTGEKDAVDENGKPKYQGMQASSSEVMANIIAELQSLRKRVAELEAA